MTVSYRVSMTDTWQYLGYLSTRTITGRFLLVLVLVAPLVGPVVSYYAATLHYVTPSHHAIHGPRFDHLLALVCLLAVALSYAVLFFSVLVGLYLGTLITPTTTITIDSEYCRLKSFMVAKTRWKQISTVSEEPEYFYFVGWTRAFSVPKRAFNSSSEACAFFNLASDYWRKAKGIPPMPPPSTSGVWPPAPRAGDSQELGGTPKG